MASVPLAGPSTGPAPTAAAYVLPGARWVPPEPEQLVVDGRRFRLSVSTVGLACCALETASAVVRAAPARAGSDPGTGGRPELPAVEVLVVAGTVTDRLAAAVVERWRRLAEPRAVVSFGACANSGGPYWDSYCVTKGVDQLLPVDVWVPGCPPRPEALLQGLRELDAVLRAAA